MLNIVLLDAYLGLGEGWLVILLLIVVLSIVAGIVFIGLGIRRLSQASGPRRMGGILLVLGGILLPILCFLGISSIVQHIVSLALCILLLVHWRPVAAPADTCRSSQGLMDYFWLMQTPLFLDALYAAGLGQLLEGLIKVFFLVVLPVGFFIYLLLRRWGKHIEKQFEREEPLEVPLSRPPLPPPPPLPGARWYRISFVLSIVLLVLLVLLVNLSDQ